MVQVDDDVPNSIVLQEQEGIFNHRPTGHRDESFGNLVG
jgi:hypothetical protein